MEGGTAAIHGGLEKTKSALLTWGVPAVGLLTGIVLGDVGLGSFLKTIIPMNLNAKAMGIITAAGFAVGGALIFSHFGLIGRFLGCLLFGMSLGVLYESLAGKKLTIPGFEAVS